MSVTVAQPNLTDTDFVLLRDLVYAKTGIALSDQKKSLLSNRLRKRLKAHGLNGFGQYYEFLTTRDACDEEFTHFLNAVTTNETYFFRNDRLWQFVRGELIPWLAAAGQSTGRRTLRIWSAASSTGAEAYSMAIALIETLPDSALWNIHIVGSDISEKVLAQAREAVYDEYALQKIDSLRRRRHFAQDATDNRYRLRDHVRERVEFRFHNLREPFPGPKFDVVLLRNVMMYFDLAMKKCALKAVTDALAPGGYLIVGDVDPMREGTDLRGHCRLEYVRPSVYRLPSAGTPRADGGD